MQKKKRELIETLGSYNADANLNQNLIRRYKTEIYDRQISLSERVETWNEELFEPKVFGVNLLSHPALNDNPLFKQIKEAFVQYNKEALGIQQKFDQEHVKSTKMTELLKVMINILELDDKDIQLNSLKKAHKWMKDNLKVEPDKYEVMKKNLKALQVTKKIELPKIPSTDIQEEIKDYKDHFRTSHEYAPQDRIKYYKRRQLNFEDSLKIMPRREKKQVKQNKIKYIRPQSDFGFEIQEEHPGSGNEGEGLEVVEPGLENMIVQEAAVVEFDNQAGEDQEVEPELPEQDDKVGKLNPRTKVYTCPDEPDYEKSEIILQHRFKLQITKEERQARQDYESEIIVRKLADRKGRFHTQLSRKLESLREMKKMAKLENESKIRSMTKTQYPVKDLAQFRTQTSIPESPYEELTSQIKVKEVKKTASSALSFIQGDIPNQREGLSMYGKKKHHENKKWLSLILKDHKSNQALQHSLDEIQDIKVRLTQDRVPFELKKIYEGILKPPELTSEAMTTIGQPQGRLLSNPDFKVGKKKKKKKKK